MNTYFVRELDEIEVEMHKAGNQTDAVLAFADDRMYAMDDLEYLVFEVFEAKVNSKKFGFNVEPTLVEVK